jgi:hypothetical protein
MCGVYPEIKSSFIMMNVFSIYFSLLEKYVQEKLAELAVNRER